MTNKLAEAIAPLIMIAICFTFLYKVGLNADWLHAIGGLCSIPFFLFLFGGVLLRGDEEE